MGKWIEDSQYLSIIDAMPIVTIDFVVADTKGRVLLGRRVNRPAQGTWFVLGGRILKGELLDEAIRRLSQRELGVTITHADCKLVGVYDQFFPDNVYGVEGIDTHMLSVAFRYELPDGVAVHPDEQHAELKWWDVLSLLASPEVHENSKVYFQNSGPAGSPCG